MCDQSTSLRAIRQSMAASVVSPERIIYYSVTDIQEGLPWILRLCTRAGINSIVRPLSTLTGFFNTYLFKPRECEARRAIDKFRE
jgi:hypothetical protein